MLDVCDNRRVIGQQSKLGLSKHVNILLVLERRALWFSNRGHSCKDYDRVLYEAPWMRLEQLKQQISLILTPIH